MASSDPPEPDAAAQLGALLTGTEAHDLGIRIGRGDTLTSALRVIAPDHRSKVRTLLTLAGLGVADRPRLIAVLGAIEGAHSVVTRVEPIWTMPGHVAQSSRLTSSVAELVGGARLSVTCSTYNFQRTSALWSALGEAARRPEVDLRIYVDAGTSRGQGTPSASELARHLRPGQVFRTVAYGGRLVRNHAKFIVIDHRLLFVTSANFSWSAEHGNAEFGVLLENPNLADSVEREVRRAEDSIYERVRASA